MFSEIEREFWNSELAESPRTILRLRLSDTCEAVIAPTAGCEIPYHLLMFPERPVFSFAQLEAAELGRAFEYLEVIRSALEPETGPIILAEHGAACQSNRGSACVSHAHMHIIPLGDKVHELRLAYFAAGGHPAYMFSDTCRFPAGLDQKPYVALSTWEHELLVWENAEIFGSQFVRRACAEVLYGTSRFFDWRRYPFNERLRYTTQTASHFLQEAIDKKFPGCRIDLEPGDAAEKPAFGQLAAAAFPASGWRVLLNPHLALADSSDIGLLCELATAPNPHVPEAAMDRLRLLVRGNVCSRAELEKIAAQAKEAASYPLLHSNARAAARDLIQAVEQALFSF